MAPDTPYDLFSSAPLLPGVVCIRQLASTATYGFRKFDASLSAGFGYVRGSVSNASYWGESLFPTLNPHLGSQALSYAVTFPQHAGQDDGTAFRASILGGSVATADGALRIRGGWFDLAQTDRFVFVPPTITSLIPAIGFATAESLGNGRRRFLLGTRHRVVCRFMGSMWSGSAAMLRSKFRPPLSHRSPEPALVSRSARSCSIAAKGRASRASSRT